MHSKRLGVPSTWVYFGSPPDRKPFTGRLSLFMSVTSRAAAQRRKLSEVPFYLILYQR